MREWQVLNSKIVIIQTLVKPGPTRHNVLLETEGHQKWRTPFIDRKSLYQFVVPRPAAAKQVINNKSKMELLSKIV